MAEENKNENIEMITGDPKKAIVKLTIPMVLSMVLTMLYIIADSIWVAGLGPDALAAIGFITPLFMVLVGLGSGIGAGANSLIARFIGADNYKQANNAGLHALLLCVIIFNYIYCIDTCIFKAYFNIYGSWENNPICNGLWLYHVCILNNFCLFRCCISNI